MLLPDQQFKQLSGFLYWGADGVGVVKAGMGVGGCGTWIKAAKLA
jgi:hypothetical protein